MWLCPAPGAEIAPYVHHAFDGPGQACRERDERAVAHLAGKGHDTRVDTDPDLPVGEREQLLDDVVAHLGGEIVVRAEEDLEEVGAAHDPLDRAGRVDDRQPLDVMGGHEARGLRQ